MRQKLVSHDGTDSIKRTSGMLHSAVTSGDTSAASDRKPICPIISHIEVDFHTVLATIFAIALEVQLLNNSLEMELIMNAVTG